MRIAIVGSGISGLTAASLLYPRHEITLFEANNYVGGHTNTIAVAADEKTVQIDTGFIVFNERTYPNFSAMLSRLNVESQPTRMSFSVRCDQTGLEYRGVDLNGLFAQRRNLFRPGFHRLLRDFVRFGRSAAEVSSDKNDKLTVNQFFRREKYSDEFVQKYFLPMGSAIWSCPRDTFGQFPVRFVVEFYQNHGLLGLGNHPQWRVVSGGSRRYVEAMIKPFADRIRLQTPVQRVERFEDTVRVWLPDGQASFDHVLFACHSDQALAMLGPDASTIEQEVLSEFPYEQNVAVLHTDTSLLPRSKRAWACWNYRIPAGESAKATVTYNANLLQSLHTRETYCITLNDEESIEPDKVLRRIVYHHPVFTTGRRAAQLRHQELVGGNRTSFCGAYWGNGFHEDGVNSAIEVCEILNRQLCTAAST